jgi:hypothetical protein
MSARTELGCHTSASGRYCCKSLSASVIARRDCDMPYPGCRVVRASMALLRVLPVLVTAWFCVTCGVTLMARRLAT